MVKILEEIQLTISDNGFGINYTPIIQLLNTFGLNLMKCLSEDINAKMQIMNNNGKTIIVRCKERSFIKDYDFSEVIK